MNCFSFFKQARLTSLLALAAIAFSIVAASRAQAAVLSLNAAAPSDNILASQLTNIGPGTQDGGRNFADNGGPPGQTFTVSAAGTANRVTVKGRGDSAGSWNNGPQPMTGAEVWKIQIASVNTVTGALTELLQELTPGIVAPAGITDYLTFKLATPVALSPGTTYAFSITVGGGVNGTTEQGWFGLAHSGTDVYANGVAFNNDLDTTTHTNANTSPPKRVFNGFVNPDPGAYDYVFAVQAVPEPATLALVAVGMVGLGIFRRR